MSNITPIASLDDPRLAPYRSLKDRELAREGDRFIAEGEPLVRRLIASTLPVESVLLAERRADLAREVPAHVPVYLAPADVVNGVLGFKFHSGVMAVGRRPTPPTLDSIAAAHPGRATFVVLPETNNSENLGAMIRVAAALGVAALILGPRSADPFYRQTVRVSMGAVFHLPIVRSQNLESDLTRLRDHHAVQLFATVLDPDAQPLDTIDIPPRHAILFGSEGPGLSPAQVSLCQRRVTIPMHLGTDSLNVAVAAGIFLYHFTRQQ